MPGQKVQERPGLCIFVAAGIWLSLLSAVRCTCKIAEAQGGKGSADALRVWLKDNTVFSLPDRHTMLVLCQHLELLDVLHADFQPETTYATVMYTEPGMLLLYAPWVMPVVCWQQGRLWVCWLQAGVWSR